ncbi:MAG: NAD(P)/FAD-dependent oxidoreductase [Pseudomonadota bacterium]
MTHSKKIAVIGAGPMGLMAAYELLKKGHQITIVEADDRIGGMSASFDFSGTKIERYYHFICATDYPLFELLKEFDLYEKLKWKDTYMGYFYEGKLYPWGSPLSLLKFPKLSFLQKLRYGLFAFYATKIKDWREYDKIYSKDWVTKWIGKKAYDVLWESLFKYKFYEYKDSLSAAWLGTRIKRVGLSRRNIFQESLGYLQGGSDVLLEKMVDKITEMGGEIILQSKVQAVNSTDNCVDGITFNNTFHKFDAVISTVPLPYVSKLVPGLSDETRDQIDAIKNVGVACAIYKLKISLTKNFWTNVSDATMEIPGVIEYSNLNNNGNVILYVPYYMPKTHSKWGWRNDQFIGEINTYLKKINPQFNNDWIIDAHVSRYEFAQTVCTPNFYQQLPPMKSEIKNFFMADTAYYYPEDRSISESIQVGKKLAECLND